MLIDVTCGVRAGARYPPYYRSGVIYLHKRYTTSEVFQERAVVEIDRCAIAGFNFKRRVLHYATSTARGTRVRRHGSPGGDASTRARKRDAAGHARPYLGGWSITPRLRRPGVGGRGGERRRKGARGKPDGDQTERVKVKERESEKGRGVDERIRARWQLSFSSLARSLARPPRSC